MPAAGRRAPSSARVIEPWVAAHTAAEVGAALKKAGALWAPYQTFRELAPRQGRRARQPDVHRARPARHRPLSGGGLAAAVRRRSARSRPGPRRCSASIRTRSCPVSSACRRTRSPGCMTRRSWVAPDRDPHRRRRHRRPGGGAGAGPEGHRLAGAGEGRAAGRDRRRHPARPQRLPLLRSPGRRRDRARDGGLYRPAPADGRAWPTARSPTSTSARRSAPASAIPTPWSIAATCMACC